MTLKYLNPKALIITLEIVLPWFFFIGVFFTDLNNKAEFNSEHWYYVNRGEPKAWTGISTKEAGVPFPLVKVPFPVITSEDGSQLLRVVDLSTFLPGFLPVFIIAYLPILFLIRRIEENKGLVRLFIVALAIPLLFMFNFWSNWI